MDETVPHCDRNRPLLARLTFPVSPQSPSDPASTLEAALLSTAPTLRPAALRAALSAWNSLQGRGEIASPLLTVIDYGLPSTARSEAEACFTHGTLP